MALFFLHGVVDDWTPSFVNRNYAPHDAFEAHLRSRQEPYGRWQDAGHADHLSIDDSTRAGATACQLARSLGHEVTFFINPEPIETGVPYFFTYLDAFIDARAVARIEFEGRIYDLEPLAERRRFRRAVKVAVMRRPSEEAVAVVKEVGRRLGAAGTSPPAHTMPISEDELSLLAETGVRIENHGWSHLDISGLDEPGFRYHVEAGRAWLTAHLGWASRLYAVPFGVSDIPTGSRFDGDAYFLARSDLPPSQLTDLCWNRHDLTPGLQRPMGVESLPPVTP